MKIYIEPQVCKDWTIALSEGDTDVVYCWNGSFVVKSIFRSNSYDRSNSYLYEDLDSSLFTEYDNYICSFENVHTNWGIDLIRHLINIEVLYENDDVLDMLQI